jgi:ABC-type multidrug transport system fused ATPase/permease subunit
VLLVLWAVTCTMFFSTVYAVTFVCYIYHFVANTNCFYNNTFHVCLRCAYSVNNVLRVLYLRDYCRNSSDRGVTLTYIWTGLWNTIDIIAMYSELLLCLIIINMIMTIIIITIIIIIIIIIPCFPMFYFATIGSIGLSVWLPSSAPAWNSVSAFHAYTDICCCVVRNNNNNNNNNYYYYYFPVNSEGMKH